MNWIGWVQMIFGLWLLFSPATFGYTSHAMRLSDHISGAIALLLGLLAIRRPLFLWGLALVGLWLQFAPLIFWSPDASAYLNDTLIGVLILAFALVVGGTPGVEESSGPEVPPGWSYNPSSYFQRIPVIGMNCLCWFIARYLAAFQLGYIDTVFDPVFGGETIKVLTSTVSKAFPVPDAGLGALAYTLEALTGFGAARRWHTTPWQVALFGILVVPVSCVSIVLIILQPLVVGAWCFLCIVIAILMLCMIPFSVDEVVAVCQFLHRSVKEGRPFWKTFFKGRALPAGEPDKRTPSFDAPAGKMFKAMYYGVSMPWNLLVSAALGLAAIFLTDFIPGALTIVFSVIAFGEPVRAIRFLIVPLGIWICFLHPLLGLAVIASCLRKGRIKEKYGSWNKMIV